MYDIKIVDEFNLEKYIKNHRIKGIYKYLFTFDKSYIFIMKENKSINTYYVISSISNVMVSILRSKKEYSDNIRNKLIKKFINTPYYEMTLKDDPQDMIEFIFTKLMAENGFKVRKNQIELSKVMYKGINKNHIEICEAAVGIGKTYAYIVASIVYVLYERQRRIKSGLYTALNNKEIAIPCVISTSSIELQKAIVATYLPILSNILKKNKIINNNLSAVLRKGKEHYLCVNRYNRLINYLRNSEKAVDKELLIKLNELGILHNGIDLDKYKGLKNHVIQKINVPKGCGSYCPHFNECNYIKYMDYLKSSKHDFQVCNHNYYLADSVKRSLGKRTLIPEHFVAVIDEAHKLPEAAIQILGESFRSEDITVMSNILKSSLKGNKAYLKTAKEKLQELSTLRNKFFNSLTSKINIDMIGKEESKINIEIERYEKNILYNMYKNIINIKRYCEEDISKGRSLEIMIEEVEKKIKVFMNTNKITCWLENPKSKKLISLCCTPIDIEEQLNKILWKNGIPKILTSATLSDDRGFKYYKSKAGIDNVSKSCLGEISLPSSFDYRSNTLLYISENIPFPNKQSEEYIKVLAEEIIKIVETTFGHAVILFTSYSLMSKVYEVARHKINYPVMKMDKSEKNIVEKFKNSRNGVLFATGSFWEGVDCPGDILSSLIIVNLPFPTPTPILDYKKKQYEELSEFIEQIIFPEMLIKLKQGMGRLIRCETDTGLIAILDFRISKKGKYRKRLLEALKDYRVTDSIHDVGRFFRKVKKEEYFL
ncbi:UNVERIFIED_ORG: helicase c2 [Clostridium botulinum]